MEEILRFEHVSYAYEEEREALLDVCVKVCAGERVAVLGSNGAGKSTFFLLANGVLRPGARPQLFLLFLLPLLTKPFRPVNMKSTS